MHHYTESVENITTFQVVDAEGVVMWVFEDEAAARKRAFDANLPNAAHYPHPKPYGVRRVESRVTTTDMGAPVLPEVVYTAMGLATGQMATIADECVWRTDHCRIFKGTVTWEEVTHP